MKSLLIIILGILPCLVFADSVLISGSNGVSTAQAIGGTDGKRTFSMSSAQTLYIQDVVSWNSASLDIYITMVKLTP